MRHVIRIGKLCRQMFGWLCVPFTFPDGVPFSRCAAEQNLNRVVEAIVSRSKPIESMSNSKPLWLILYSKLMTILPDAYTQRMLSE